MQTISAREPHDRRQSPSDRLGVLLRAISDGVLLPRVGDAVSFSDHLHEGPSGDVGKMGIIEQSVGRRIFRTRVFK
jgi:hypothetical protein